MRKTVLTVPAAVYPLQVVYAASCVFLDRAEVCLKTDGRGGVVVTLEPKPHASRPSAQVKLEFHNELSRQALRLKAAPSRARASAKDGPGDPVPKDLPRQAGELLDYAARESRVDDPAGTSLEWGRVASRTTRRLKP